MAGLARRAVQRAWQAASGRVAVAGQATHQTHPELLAEGELAPGIAAAEFAARRARLAAALPPGSLALLPAAPPVYMAGVIPYPYRQDVDFRYLTGLTQPGVAVIEAAASASSSSGGFTLFVPPEDREREAWDGPRVSPQAAVEVFGADEAYPLTELASKVAARVAGASAVYYDCERPMSQLHRDAPALYAAAQAGRVRDLRPLLHSLRWVKSPAELDQMRRSASISAAALTACMRASQPGVAEHVLAALFEFECKRRGAQRMAYPQVVAGGPDACTIHYSRNDKRVAGGQLVLMDAGCELHGYASDVTRTWPVSGRFSAAQRAVYDVVLDAHRQCINACRPGATLRQVHRLSIQLLSEGLSHLGLARASPDVIALGAYRPFYPHSVGHWLGLDTHDTPLVPHDRPLQPGVVLTIEPGLYIPDEPDRYGALAGIGVRLEDDVAVTEAGLPEVLSRDVPLEPAAVEELVGGG